MRQHLVIDNPGQLALDEDVVWLERLISLPGDCPRLTLLGFSDDDVIAVRQRLAERLPPGDILHWPAEHERALVALDPALWRHSLALAGEGAEWVGHAGQCPRRPADEEVPPAPATPNRPRLAFVSPLPPEATGIADYSAELLPYLAAHYDITLVIHQQALDSALDKGFEVLDPQGFRANLQHFDRVLYQVGNSPYHAYQFPLLRDIPGSVVLHDLYLCDAVWWLQESGQWSQGLRQRLFEDHGFPSVLALETAPQASSPRGPEHYPVNGFVTGEAAGLIVHSEFAHGLDRRWRPQAWHETVHCVPHLRELPVPVDAAQRHAARAALGLEPDTCVIASFGGINPKKLSDVLVEAVLDETWPDAPPLHLVLVGAQHAGDFGQRLEQYLHRHPRGWQVTVTGYVSREDYGRWLQAADIAVQLRQASRGESSGAVLDAMARGLAVVVNDHGSNSELPEEGAVRLPERLTAASLAEALRALVGDAPRRRRLGESARRYVAEVLDPPRVAERYRQAIEEHARHARRHRHERWLDRLAASAALAAADADTQFDATRRLSELAPGAPAHQPRLLFDVSTIAWHDLKTGIERVTRRLADRLLRHPPPGWQVELIRWGGDDFHLARGFASEQLGIAPPAPDRPCEPRPGDVYVSVEWAPPLLEQAGQALRQMRARGVRCYFTVHDLLPLRLPHCFPDDTPSRMRSWFEGIAGLADGITAVSATVADDVRSELATLALAHPPWVHHFHLGADFTAAESKGKPAADEHRLLTSLDRADGATLLMVGTLEPRKGHRQVLEALDHCWERQLPLNLVIVGKQGWDVDKLSTRLRHHPQRGKRLFWVDGASDALLKRLYAQSDALLAASLGEGFGLPLIEAAYHGIAILARDIPVFREVAGEYADYFAADTPGELADELQAWQRRWQAGTIRDSRGMPHQSWAQSAEQWLGLVLADQPVPLAPAQPPEET